MGKQVPQKIKDLYPYAFKRDQLYLASSFDEYFNLLLNAVKITKKNGEAVNFAVEDFAKRALFGGGAVGYDKLIDKFYFVAGEGVNDLGNPYYLNFYTANGKTYRRVATYEPKEEGAYIINATPTKQAIADLIRETTDFMNECNVAIWQNLRACKTPYIVICRDDNLRLSFEQAIEQKQTGQAVVVVSNELGEGLKAVDIGVNYLADKFQEISDHRRDLLLNKLGIMSASYKKERVQGAEVNASLGQVTDYVYLLIDTFNKQCETYDIDYKMSFNGSLEEIYFDGDSEDGEAVQEVDVNDVEEKDKIKYGL